MHRKSTLWSAALAASVSLALALPAFAQGQSEGSKSSPGGTPSFEERTMPQSSERVAKTMEDKAATEADRMLNLRIRQTLTGDMTLAYTVIQKIHLDTDNGEVTLHGSGVSDQQKTDIAAKVQQVAGVKKVDNQLQTASN
jgi:osmotically-inducible protein OsmY